MPTTVNDHPFRPPGQVSAEDLLRYARGGGDAAERQRMEQHLLADPLLAEAAEGLQQVDAVQGWERWQADRPKGWFRPIVMLSAVALVSGAVVLTVLRSDEQPPTVHQSAGQHAVGESNTPTPSRNVESMEAPGTISAAVRTVSIPLAEAHAGERPGSDVVTMPARPVKVPTRSTPDNGPGAPLRSRASRQLVFLHDLKLVHPDELHGSPPARSIASGVPASQETAGDTVRWPAGQEAWTRPYLDHFDQVLQDVEKGRDLQALTGLAVILDQYPDDVNALFYAGYSAYRAGAHERAIELLHRAAVHGVDTFREEAAWYEALAVLEGRGVEEALPALRGVERERGFYSARASALIGLLAATPSGSR